MRLIYADRLYDEIQNKTGFYDNQDIDVVLDVIDSQPTAYDVDKVELLLKAETERINNLDWRKKDAYELGRRDAVKFAIDIIKRGRVDE